MCGIVGIIAKSSVAGFLLEGLQRLEYRGYDSAGIATNDGKELQRCRAKGKLVNLQHALQKNSPQGNVGIAHTRWATHGEATEQNAHPHATDKVAVVHNGIIENFHDLRENLISNGIKFTSETDTEVIVHLIDKYLKEGNKPAIAVQKTLDQLEGAFALSIIFKEHPNLLIGARRGSPLVLGITNENLYMGSDAWALAPWTQNICYLEDGDMAQLSFSSSGEPQWLLTDNHHKNVNRLVKQLNIMVGNVTKGDYSHFMQKEIYEQPQTISDTLQAIIHQDDYSSKIDDLVEKIANAETIKIIACGSSYYAGMAAKYWFESFAKISTEVDLASEFRYRQPVLNEKTLCIFVSQSGETIDTLSALYIAKKKNAKTLAIVNVPESAMVREAEHYLLTHAGLEIGVASTKAFTAQLVALASLSLILAKQRNCIDDESYVKHCQELFHVPLLITNMLHNVRDYDQISYELTKVSDVLFIGRGTNYPIALEGALKLKEISYIHAEGYASGELKHGPIALVDRKTPIIALSPDDSWYEKHFSNVKEVLSRGAPVIILHQKDLPLPSEFMKTIKIPESDSLGNTFTLTVAVQLLAYYTALHKGTDVDQPRNLAKSVTVE